MRAAGGTIEILNSIPIVGQSGKPVTGLSNIEGKDEPAYDYTALTALPYNPNGMDTEGLVGRRAASSGWRKRTARP